MNNQKSINIIEREKKKNYKSLLFILLPILFLFTFVLVSAILVSIENPPNGTRSNSSTQNFTLNATDDIKLGNGFLYIWNQSGDVLFRETIIETADASRVEVGDDLSGDWQNTTVKDGIVMHIGEVGGGQVPAYLVFFNFTNMTDKNNLWNISLFAQYKGASADEVFIFLFNNTGNSWDDTTFRIDDGNELEWHTFFLDAPTDYVDGSGVVQMAINHTTAGSNSHYLNIDYLAIQNNFPYSGSINLTDFNGIETGIEKTLSSGNYTWNYNVFDNASQGNWSNSNFSLLIDLISPDVSILHPLDDSSIFGNLTFQANFSVSDTQSPISSCWYNLNGNITNTTIPSCNNFTITALNTSNTLIIYSNDSVGNEGFDTSTFTASEIIPSKLTWDWFVLMEDKLLPTEICFSIKAGDICFDSPITAAVWQLVSGVLKPINSSAPVKIDNNLTVNGRLTVEGGGVNISLDGDKSLLINGNPREVTEGHVRIEHRPAVSGTTPLRILVDAAGFGVIGTIIDYAANDWTEENNAAGVRINFDTSNASGGHFNAFHCTKSGNGTAKVDCLDIRSGINPIHQRSGSVGNVTIAFLFDDSSSTFTTVTNEFNNASENTSIFDDDNDIVYIGNGLTFDEIDFILQSGGSKSIVPIFEYSNGSGTWVEFEASDGTNGMQVDGGISVPNSIYPLWQTDTVNGISDMYWLRITRTQNNMVAPIEQLVQVTTAVEYEWDSEGNLLINNLRLRGGQINFDSGNFTVLGTNSTMRLFQNPTSEFGFKIFSVEDITGDTGLSIVQAGENRASSSKRSFLIGNGSSFCNNVTDLIDCNTSTTGADLWVADDIALGGSLFAANGKFNVTDNGGLEMSGNLDMNGNNITNVSHLFVSNISGNSPVTILDSNGEPLIIFDEDSNRKIMVNATIIENIFDVDGNIGFFFKNNNNGTNASTLISLLNDEGNNMTMGISGSNFDLVNETNNSGFIFLNSRGAPLILANGFNKSISFMNNPSDDGNPTNLREIVSIGKNGINLIIKKLIGQVTNLFEIRDENNNLLLSMDNSGNLNISGDLHISNIKLSNTSKNGLWEGNLNIETDPSTNNNLLFLLQHKTDGTPHFWIQEGGDGQASGISRSFMIVNEVQSVLNSTNLTSCAANGVVNIDCNTSTTGADLFVGDDIEIGGDMWAKDTDDEWHFISRILQLLDENFQNLIYNSVEHTISNNNLTFIDSGGDSLVVNIDSQNTIFSNNNETIALNLGNSTNPAVNFISYQNKDNPILVITTNTPSVSHADVAVIFVGNSSDNIYLDDGTFSHAENFVDNVYDRLGEQGSIYKSGLNIGINPTRLNISSGDVRIRLNLFNYENLVDSSVDFYFIKSNGDFIEATSNTAFTEYSDGTTIGNNKYFNVVWGIVPINSTGMRLIAVVQDYPGSGSEYSNAVAAETDDFEKTNFFPSNEFIKVAFIPVARTIMKKDVSADFENLKNGNLFLDLRGKSTIGGGSPAAPSITDHDDLNNLNFSASGHTGFLSDSGDTANGNYTFNGAINITGIPDGTFTCYAYNVNGGCMLGGNSTCNILFSPNGLVSQEICN